ncbi:venom serine carboxypeptidase [Hyalella azteca]|uniref:Carboxypeptidase n=1 Tax=Hyalella azteca TaxID=294128 RepID=A0A8B7PQ52_HYAAZ|nr:venom serine carboxypeptidase [Hyalella azteca]
MIKVSLTVLVIFLMFLIYVSTPSTLISEPVDGSVNSTKLISHFLKALPKNKVNKTKVGLLRHFIAPIRNILPANGKLEDCGEPLFLTPLLKQGKIKEARNLSRVELPNDSGATHSFSGFFNVDEENGSEMFFWFFPAKITPEVAPLLIWLQGGPGGSSLFGLFAENGPFGVDANMQLVYRNSSWSNTHNLLYFDNPVGTGFSFTTKDAGYATNESAVGEGLYSALLQFLTLFPELRRNELYVSGESYAGKYVPALSYTIHKHNPSADVKINFKGMAIGDGLCDPVTMLDYGDFLYDVGLLDEVQRDLFRKKQVEIRSYIAKGLWQKAFITFDELLNGDTTDTPSIFTNATGLTFYYNYLTEREPDDMNFFGKYINEAEVRRAIHVGKLAFNDGKAVEQHLINDVMQSVKPWIEEILNQTQYRVMIYNGQLDIIIAYPLTRNFVESLKWRDSDAYLSAPRRIWKVDGDVAGYVKETRNFVEVLVRGAGHMVPYDQPARAYDMINRFTGADAGKTSSSFMD